MRDILKKMIDNLEEEKKNLNQFYLNTKYTQTEIYRTDSYIEQLKGIIEKLNILFEVYEKLGKSKLADDQKTKQYSKLYTSIARELHFLKATNHALSENIEKINKADGVQGRIIVNTLILEKAINTIVEKAEDILNI